MTGKLRLLIIGNSHVSAFRDAWNEVGPRHLDVECSFFAAPINKFKAMCLGRDLTFGLPAARNSRDDRVSAVVAKINGGKTSVDLSGADLVLLAGHQLRNPVLCNLLAANDVDGLRRVGAPGLLSPAAFEAILDSLVQKGVPQQGWRHWDGPRLLVAPRPLPSERICDIEGPNSVSYKAVYEQPEGALVALDRFWDRTEEALARVGIGFLRPPMETVTQAGLTLDHYFRGSSWISDGKTLSETEVSHANGLYGALCLEGLLGSRHQVA